MPRLADYDQSRQTDDRSAIASISTLTACKMCTFSYALGNPSRHSGLSTEQFLARTSSVASWNTITIHACMRCMRMYAHACMFTCSRNLETAICILCTVGTTYTLSIIESRQAVGALQGASIVGSCVHGSPITHAELPRSARILANCRFQVSNR